MTRWLVFIAVMLAGCTAARAPTPQVVTVTPPLGLLVCPPDPLAPDPEEMTQDDVAYLYLEQFNVTQICRASIKNVEKWGEEINKDSGLGNGGLAR